MSLSFVFFLDKKKKDKKWVVGLAFEFFSLWENGT